MVGWYRIIYWKEERIWRGLLYLLERTEENHKRPEKVAGLRAEIRNLDSPETRYATHTTAVLNQEPD